MGESSISRDLGKGSTGNTKKSIVFKDGLCLMRDSDAEKKRGRSRSAAAVPSAKTRPAGSSPRARGVHGVRQSEVVERDKTPKVGYKARGDGTFRKTKPQVPVRSNADSALDERAEVRQDYSALEKKLTYKFKKRELLNQALTHSSAFPGKGIKDYERLEFLGDAVLGLAVAKLLSDFHPEVSEGDLTKMRAALVNGQALAQVAREVQIGQFINLGRVELSSGGRDRVSILSDVLEAIFGAMFVDGGYDATFETISYLFKDRLEKVTPFDPKTELQERLHLDASAVPQYRIEVVEGSSHEPVFVAVALVDGEVVGRGRGLTKKAAHQEAAAEVLRLLTYPCERVELSPGQTVLMASCLLIGDNRSGPG